VMEYMKSQREFQPPEIEFCTGISRRFVDDILSRTLQRRWEKRPTAEALVDEFKKFENSVSTERTGKTISRMPSESPEGPLNSESASGTNDPTGRLDEALILNLRDATEKMKVAEYADAEALLREALDTSEKVFGLVFRERDRILELLAVASARQGELHRAAEIFSGLLTAKTLGGKRQVNVMHELAEVYLALSELDKAEALCIDAIQGWKTVLPGQDHVLRFLSIDLLSQIYQKKNNLDKAEYYAKLLPPSIQGMIRNEVQTLMSDCRNIEMWSRQKPEQAAESVREHFIPVLWEKNPEWPEWERLSSAADIERNILGGKGLIGTGHPGYNFFKAVVQIGNEHAFQLLVEKGVDICPPTESWNPLHVAAWKGHTSIAASLIAMNVLDINAKCHRGGRNPIKEFTALHLAVIAAHEDVVEVLMEGMADKEARLRGRTPLFIAVERGHEMVARILVKNGADVNAVSNGQTALDLASGNYAMTRLLLRHGAVVKGDLDVTTRMVTAEINRGPSGSENPKSQ